MRALDPEVVEAVWAAVEGVIPVPVDTHPLGRHRRRVPDRLCFEGMLIRLVTGCSWEDTERLLRRQVSDTTLRSRRDQWVRAGVFDLVVEEAISGYDRLVGLDLSVVALDGSQQKAPRGGQGTGPNPVDRAKTGWKWSVAVDRNGIPVGWSADGANRNDCILAEPTLQAISLRGLAADIGTIHLDRGYDYDFVRGHISQAGISAAVISLRRPYRTATTSPRPLPLGMRWIVERTNSWLTNYGQLRRNTDRRPTHRLAQLALAITLIIVAKLIDWRHRWQPQPPPIR